MVDLNLEFFIYISFLLVLCFFRDGEIYLDINIIIN